MKKSKKKNKIVYNIPDSQSISLVCEQLGLNLYTTEQQNIPSLEISHSKFSKVSFLNDIDLNQWKEYGEIITDSLWLLGARDKSGVHTGELHGNFIPQIPHQALLRYTKRDEIVLDTFLGSGTTLIECKKERIMEKEICYLGEKFKVRYFFDTDVRKKYIDFNTGEEFDIILGDIEGIEIYNLQGNLIGSFDYVDFNNDNAIRNLIKNNIREDL